jgi:MFS family permease
LGSVIGKLFFGWLCDQIPAKLAWAIALGLGLTGILIMLNIRMGSPVTILWLYAIVIGIGLGGYLPIASMLVSSHFGLVSYGAIFGMISFLQSIGISTGPLVAGYMYDAMDTYHLTLIIFAVVCAAGISIILMVRRPKFP